MAHAPREIRRRLLDYHVEHDRRRYRKAVPEIVACDQNSVRGRIEKGEGTKRGRGGIAKLGHVVWCAGIYSLTM